MCNNFLRGLLGLCLAAALGSCGGPTEAKPALWLVEGPQGQKAWLLGTIHALQSPANWRSDTIEQALSQSDRLILEVADVGNDAATARTFARLATDALPPPLARRIDQTLRDELAAELARDAIAPGSLDRYETWAAALMIAQAQAYVGKQDSANGIDRALAKAYAGPIAEFEGAEAQLLIFDRLPQAQQHALLASVIEDDPATRNAKARRLELAWATGNTAAIARLVDEDMFADPVLREVLLVGRNRDWVRKLLALLNNKARPFVAVGAAHLAGADGLPAMLAARGYKVTRLQ
ncbi:MAG: TraB/GumN family protein [Novosphingobium sp.]|uniref:TraB/GumN family protein n=1 Tax=Novosphingobium sp. TaxID=1874826 RepID=UPI0032BB73F5